MRSTSVCRRPLRSNASRNPPRCRKGRMRGAMPPATKTPPVASTISARLPAIAPSTEQNIASAISHTGSVPAIARAEITAAGSRPGSGVASTAAVSGRMSAAAGRLLRQEREHVDEAVARQDALARDAAVLARQELDQAVLERRARREVDVAAFRRDDPVAVVGRATRAGTPARARCPRPAPPSARARPADRRPARPARRGRRR